ITYQIKISVDNNSKITVSDGIQNIVGYNYGKKIITPIGAIMFVPNKDKKLDQNLVIDVIPAEKVVDNLLQEIQVIPNKEKQSFIVNFSLNHPNRKKAELILNSLVSQYDLDATEDKIKVTRATSDFI